MRVHAYHVTREARVDSVFHVNLSRVKSTYIHTCIITLFSRHCARSKAPTLLPRYMSRAAASTDQPCNHATYHGCSKGQDNVPRACRSKRNATSSLTKLGANHCEHGRAAARHPSLSPARGRASPSRYRTAPARSRSLEGCGTRERSPAPPPR